MAELYFDEQIETLPPELLRKLQDHRLRWQFRRCWDGSAWYRARFEAAGLSPETFGGLADLERLPLQTYGELSALGAADWVVPSVECIGSWRKSRRLARQHTTGDFTHIIDREARAYWAAGAQSHSYPLVKSLPVEQRRR